jgi:hypothetical protein
MMETLSDRVAALEKEMAGLRDEACRYRSDIALRDELYGRTGTALLTFIRILHAELTVYRDAVLDGDGQFPAIIAAFEVFVTAVIAELDAMITCYEPVFAEASDVIDG